MCAPIADVLWGLLTLVILVLVVDCCFVCSLDMLVYVLVLCDCVCLVVTCYFRFVVWVVGWLFWFVVALCLFGFGVSWVGFGTGC